MVDFYPLMVESTLEFKTEYKVVMAKYNSKNRAVIKYRHACGDTA